MLKIEKKIILLLLLFVFTFSVIAFEVVAAENWWVHPPKNGKNYVIGYNPRARLSPVWSILLAQAKKTAEELGVELRVLDIESETDAVGQLKVIEDFITQDVDFIVASPADEKAIIASIMKGEKAKIPIGLVISKAETPGVNTAFWMSCDDYLGAVKLADHAAQYMNYKADVVLIQGVLGQYSCTAREQGFEDVFKTYPNINIIARQTANWEREKGTKVMEDLIVQLGDKIEAIIAFNEEMGIGAARAYQAAGKTCPPIFSYNGHLEALEKTKSGMLTATVDMNWALVGETMLRQAVGILKGEKPMGQDITIPTNLVNQGNIDFYINKLKDLGM